MLMVAPIAPLERARVGRLQDVDLADEVGAYCTEVEAAVADGARNRAAVVQGFVERAGQIRAR